MKEKRRLHCVKELVTMCLVLHYIIYAYNVSHLMMATYDRKMFYV